MQSNTLSAWPSRIKEVAQSKRSLHCTGCPLWSRLPVIVPVKSLGYWREQPALAVREVVPVASIVLLLSAGT